jgi:hypothetical protein
MMISRFRTGVKNENGRPAFRLRQCREYDQSGIHAGITFTVRLKVA